MMLESYSTAGFNIIQSVLRRLPRQIYTSFVLRERLKNNTVNEGKIRRWSN